MGMVDELAEKVHPVFRDLVCPPCIKGDDFTGCIYQEECRRRLSGDDLLPPCPLHIAYHELDSGQSLALNMHKLKIPMKREMNERAKLYANFWGRDPYTGKRLKENEKSK